MWPMSHALYPGLNNNPERPSTSDSHKTWYGNNRKSYASSISSRSDERSIHSFAYEKEATGEDLGDLITRSRRVLSVLSVDADKDKGSQPDQARQSIESHGGTESRNNIPRNNNESMVLRGGGWQSPEEALGGSEAGVRSHRITTAASSLRYPGPATRTTSNTSRSSTDSAFVSFTSPDGSEGYTTVSQLRQSLSENPTPGPGPRGPDGWNPETPSHLSGVSTPQNSEPALSAKASNIASNKAGSDIIGTPNGDRTAAPSISIPYEGFSEKKPESVHFKTLMGSDDELVPGDSKGNQEKDQPEEQAAEDDPTLNHLSGLPLVSVTIALSAAVFLVAMDVNVIATAIPRITGEFRSLDDVGWYGSAFLMATCATQIPYGRIYSLFPAKWVFTSAIIIFMIGSLIAAVSPSSPILILGRAVQGFGTSGILSGGLIIMSQVVPLRIRPVLTSAIGAMEGVAMISAPIIGGVLTDNLHWRWCFYINLPIGGFVLIVVLICLRSVKDTRPRQTGKTTLWQNLYKLDVMGALVLLPPIVCTLLALHFAGGDGHSLADRDVILLFVLAVVLFSIFAYTQHINAEVAMLPFRIVKQRSVLAGFWFITCTSSALVVITYFLPLWFQIIKETSAQQSGVGILPMLVGVIVGVLGSGALVSLIGYYTPFMLASSVLMPVGLGMLSTITPETSRAALLAYPAVFGLGVGMGFQQPLIGVQAALPLADIPTGTSVIVFGQTFGAAIMIAAGETVFQSRLLSNLASYMGITNVSSDQLLGNGPASLQALVPTERLPLLIQTVNSSLTQTFFVAVAMAALSIFGSVFMGWKSVKQPKGSKRGQQGIAAMVRTSTA